MTGEVGLGLLTSSSCLSVCGWLVLQGQAAASEGDLKIFVQGLPWAATEEEVRAFFKDCGAMTQVDLPQRDGRASGTAFVTFESAEGATAALELNEATFGDRCGPRHTPVGSLCCESWCLTFTGGVVVQWPVGAREEVHAPRGQRLRQQGRQRPPQLRAQGEARGLHQRLHRCVTGWLLNCGDLRRPTSC